MKTEIHPEYFPKAKAVCACGATYEVGSTKDRIEVEICGACHPFYTGEEKIMDTAGRVEKFKQRRAIASAKKAAAAKKTPKRKAKKKEK